MSEILFHFCECGLAMYAYGKDGNDPETWVYACPDCDGATVDLEDDE